MAGLVEFQKKLFAHMDELNALGEEEQFIRFVSMNTHFVIKADAVMGVVTLPNIIPVPGIETGVAGLIHAQGQVWTVFDFATLVASHKRTSRQPSTKAILLNSNVMSGAALMVDKTLSMVPVNEFYESMGSENSVSAWAQKIVRHSADSQIAWYIVDTDNLVKDPIFIPDEVVRS
jgi:chemotaxis signal transduction protein